MSESGTDQRVLSNQFDRTIILGNTASGKSWLSKKLGAKLSSRIVDLDQIRAIDGDCSRRETKQIAVAKTVEKAKHDQWIIEGVYGWLVNLIGDRATYLIWMDIPSDPYSVPLGVLNEITAVQPQAVPQSC